MSPNPGIKGLTCGVELYFPPEPPYNTKCLSMKMLQQLLKSAKSARALSNLAPGRRCAYQHKSLPFLMCTSFALYRCYTDPLVHHGRHFGRTVFALCNFQALLNNGIMRMVELPDRPLESLSPEFVNFLFILIF